MSFWFYLLMVLALGIPCKLGWASSDVHIPDKPTTNFATTSTNHRDALTMVTGYFKVPSKRPVSSYLKHMNNTLRINASFHVFYQDDDVREAIELARMPYPGKTVYTRVMAEDVQGMLFGYGSKGLKHRGFFETGHHFNFSWTLILVWLSKLNLLRLSAATNPFHSSWFMWQDVTLNALRWGEGVPQLAYPDITKLEALPRDKVIFSMVHVWTADCNTGGFLMHADFVPKFSEHYHKHLGKACFHHTHEKICMKPTLNISAKVLCRDACMDDQAYMTHLRKLRPDYFAHVKCTHKFNSQVKTVDENTNYCGDVMHCGWAGLFASLFPQPASEIGMCTKNPWFC